MDTATLLKKVRAVEIRSRGLTRQIFSGQYHSAFKGRGMAFSEVREYTYGDEIRNIDWNVTARMRHPYVKVFEEERELTVMLLIDVSGSSAFGTRKMRKSEMIAEISAVLAFSAIHNNDKVGVIFFSDRIEKFIPPKKGRAHILLIIRELLSISASGTGTSVREPLRFLTHAIKKRCTAFILSDFMDSGFEDAVKIASRKHDLVALVTADPAEDEIPDAGLVKFRDSESGKIIWADTSSRGFRQSFASRRMMHREKLVKVLHSSGVDAVNVTTDKDYIRPLIRLFRMRGGKV